MTDAAVTITIREQCKAATQEEFAKANSKTQLLEAAKEAGVGEAALGNAKTKADIVALIYKQFPLPDPALRGKSSLKEPVAQMWALAEARFTAFRKGDTEKPRRCDVVEEGKAGGIAHFTARTQYQAWFAHTGGGERPITAKDDGLPKGLGILLGFPEPKVEEEANA